jgi:hypothetical protein
VTAATKARATSLELERGYGVTPNSNFVAVGLTYLFNSFGRRVFGRMAENLAVSLRRQPRQIALLYCSELQADVFLSAGFLERARGSGAFIGVDPRTPAGGRA